MKRHIDYAWRLEELMEARGMVVSSDLIPCLAERGIHLARSQAYGVVYQRPERISLQLCAALCDIFDCGIEELISVTAADAHNDRADTADRAVPPIGTRSANVIELNRSVRAWRTRMARDAD